MWLLTKNRKIGRVIFFSILLLVSTRSISQTTLEDSIVITGANAKVSISQIPKRELKKIQRISTDLMSTFDAATSFSAESAFKNGNHALSANIWGDIAHNELFVKRSKTNWASAILRKSEAEEQYDIVTALDTIEKALQRIPDSAQLLEKSAVLSISQYQLLKAKNRLLSLNNILENSTSNSPLTRYLTHFRLWVVYAALGQAKNSMEQAIFASRTFNSSLSTEEQKDFLEDQRSLYASAILSQIDRVDKNPMLFEEFRKTQKVFDAGEETLHLANHNGKHWISIETGEVASIPTRSSMSMGANRFENSELILGAYQSKMVDLINKFIQQAKEIESANSTAARKLFHKTYDELIELSGKCVKCGDFAKRRHFASYLLGSYYFETEDYQTANFFFSKALNEIRNADAVEDYNAVYLQASYLESISTSRGEEFRWIGNDLAMSTIYRPLVLALENIDQILDFDPDNGKAITTKIRLLNRLSDGYMDALHIQSSDEVCEASYQLFVRTLSNRKLSDESYSDFFNCQKHLIILSGLEGDVEKKEKLIGRLADVAIKSGKIRSVSDLSWLK